MEGREFIFEIIISIIIIVFGERMKGTDEIEREVINTITKLEGRGKHSACSTSPKVAFLNWKFWKFCHLKWMKQRSLSEKIVSPQPKSSTENLWSISFHIFYTIVLIVIEVIFVLLTFFKITSKKIEKQCIIDFLYIHKKVLCTTFCVCWFGRYITLSLFHWSNATWPQLCD